MTDQKSHEPATGSEGVRCPFCGSADTERISLFGSQLLTEQLYCRACHTPFEHVKADGDLRGGPGSVPQAGGDQGASREA